jgi:ATP-dependent DNA helicase RecG
MEPAELSPLLISLTALPQETEWVEFKCNYAEPEEIGEYLSALSNAAGLHRKAVGYLVWGVEDGTHRVVGTNFKARQAKQGNEALENWLSRLLHPRIDFRIYEFDHNGVPVVMFEVQACQHTPVRFKDYEFIRVGSYKKKLRDFPEKERALWALLSRTCFEKGISTRDVSSDKVLSLLDYPSYFSMTSQNLPANKVGILERLESEKLIIRRRDDVCDITNLGAILFAKKLSDFDTVGRKAVRVIIYKGNSRIETIKEYVEPRGYAAGFEGLIAYINGQLPQNEEIGQALRKEVRMYPEKAIRELVPNAMIHQDLTMTGDSPLVEIFSDRIEFTNAGRPLIDPLRFMDEPPQSRNEALAAFMRRLNICEERGSGIDKVVFEVEMFQLPAPEFLVTENHTKIVLYAYRKLTRMDKNDKIRACYQHACLRYVSNEQMTNTSLRERFKIVDKNYAVASRIISDTVKVGLVKPYDPGSKSRKHARYVPFWT